MPNRLSRAFIVEASLYQVLIDLGLDRLESTRTASLRHRPGASDLVLSDGADVFAHLEPLPPALESRIAALRRRRPSLSRRQLLAIASQEGLKALADHPYSARSARERESLLEHAAVRLPPDLTAREEELALRLLALFIGGLAAETRRRRS